MPDNGLKGMGELGVSLSVFLVGLWLLNTAPAFNLPLAPELLAVALGCLLVARSPWPFSKPSRLLKTALILFGLHLTILVLRAGFAARGFGQVCGMMPGTIQKLECLFQAGVDQNSAVRTLGYDLAAAALFLGAFCFSHSAQARRIPQAVAFVGAAFAVISLVARAAGAPAILPDYLMTMQWDAAYSTYLMENPTWIWPYLFPAMASLYWLFAQNSRWLPRMFAATALAAIGVTCLVSQRRGGALLVLVVAAFFLTSLLERPLARWRSGSRRSMVATVGVFAGVLLVLAVGLSVLGRFHAGGALAQRFANTSMVDVARENIWKTAAEGIAREPLLGHGFASWHNEFFKLVAGRGHVSVLDTAHNYFVQSLFELGSLQLLLVLGAFACFALSSLERAPSRWDQLRMLVLAAIGYLLITSVQEFNFVRSTYYTHALFAGWLLGAGSSGSQDVTSPRRRWTFAAWVLSALALLFLWMSTLAGYQYEAAARFGYQPKVRWFKTRGTVTFVKRPKSGQGERYAVYFLRKTFTTAYQLKEFSGPGISLSFPNRGYPQLPVRIRAPWSPPDLLGFPNGKPEMGRTLAAMVNWPPTETSLPMIWDWQLSDWEPDETGEQSRRCDQDCSFRLKDCANGTRRLDLLPWPDPATKAVPGSVEVYMGTDYTQVIAKIPPEGVQIVDLRDATRRTITIPPASYVRLRLSTPGSVRLANARCEADGGVP